MYAMTTHSLINDLQTSTGHDQVLQPTRRFSSLKSGTGAIEDKPGGKSENLSEILTGQQEIARLREAMQHSQ